MRELDTMTGFPLIFSGLGQRQKATLKLLLQHPAGMMGSTIRSHLGISASAATSVYASLEKRGLIERMYEGPPYTVYIVLTSITFEYYKGVKL